MTPSVPSLARPLGSSPASRGLTSVYVHFPWCAKKCPYCDFASRKVGAGELPHQAYAEAIVQELAARSADGRLAGRTLASVFFGGGTPSLWEPAELGRVLAAIRRTFEREVPELEITMEANPNSLRTENARGYAAAGVNRISLGVQSLRAEHLQFLGRLHDRDEALRAIAIAQEAVPRVSADLMFGMPAQRTLAAEIEAVVATGVEHVSAYSLTIEPGTQFGELHRLGKLQVMDDDGAAALFELAEERFAAHGLQHYEVSNYARPGAEARHNLHYWRGGDYLGLGAAAVGALSADEPSAGARLWRNEPEGERYIAKVNAFMSSDSQENLGCLEEQEERLDAQDRIREALMLGLRTTEGVDLAALGERVGVDPRQGRESALARALERGLLIARGERVHVPRSEWLRLDSIVADLF